MKAQLVYENLDFERGGDPKKTLNVGTENILKKFSGTAFGMNNWGLVWPVKDLLNRDTDGFYPLGKIKEEDNSFEWGSPSAIKWGLSIIKKEKPYRRKKDDPSADNYSVAAAYSTPLGILVYMYRNAGYFFVREEIAKELKIWEDFVFPGWYKKNDL